MSFSQLTHLWRHMIFNANQWNGSFTMGVLNDHVNKQFQANFFV